MIKIFKILPVLFFLIIPVFSFSQQINQKLKNDNNNEEILIGICNKQVFKTGQYGEWFNSEYSYYDYQVDRKTLDSIRSLIDTCRITIVLGTWCDDSREQFPRIMAILNYLKFSDKKLTIYCVDRNKKTLRENIDELKIVNIPTIILYYNGKEIGRIVEKPQQTLEKDLSRILKGL